MVLDNAGLHHAKALNDLYAPGREPERITAIHVPPAPPTLGPTKHVRDTARASTTSPRPAEHPHRLHHQPHLRLRLRAIPQPHHHTPILFSSSHI